MKFRHIFLLFLMFSFYDPAHSDDVHSFSLQSLNIDIRGEGSEQAIFSEGSRFHPVSIQMNVPHCGWVCVSAPSYYSLTMKTRADIYIEISDLSHDAVLLYFGLDPTYSEWLTAREGQILFVEDYFVESGSTLYFAVHMLETETPWLEDHGEMTSHIEETADKNREDIRMRIDNPEREPNHQELTQRITYTITAKEDFILSPVGIGMSGEIYTDAYELKPGSTYLQTVSADGLNYYRTVVKTGPHLRITAENLSEHADMLWFDTQSGSYSGAFTVREGRTRKLEVYDLSPGTECLFYLSADVSQIGEDSTFTVTIYEFSGSR